MVLVESRASPPGWILRLRLGQARHSPYDSSHDHNTRIVLQAKLGRALPGLDGTRASVPPRPLDGAPTWASAPQVFTKYLHRLYIRRFPRARIAGTQAGCSVPRPRTRKRFAGIA